MIKKTCWIIIIAGLLSLESVFAAAKTTLVIGYAELESDPRYHNQKLYAGIEFKPRGRPWPGAEVGLRDSKIVGRALGVKFRLEKVSGENSAELASEINRLYKEQNVGFFIVDAPAETLVTVTKETHGKKLLLFNVSEPADELRESDCNSQLMHTIPSYAMLADGLAQYLVSKRWKDILLLEGILPSDHSLARAFRRAAKKFGLKITAEKEFILSNNPRQREQNNISLLTTHKSDVILIIDTDGEFGRYVPFQTVHPRPVIGTEGLVASSWALGYGTLRSTAT